MRVNNPKNPTAEDDENLASFLRTEAKARKANDDGIWELLIEAADSIDRLGRNLVDRDLFIGRCGLWDMFLKQLPN